MVAIPSEHELARGEGALTLRDVAAQPLLVYPRTPRPSYADQVLSLLRDLALEPASVLEVQEMQTALGLVASGMGLCVVPASVHRLRPDEVVYRPLAEAQAVSPIIMSTRLQDQSADIALMRQLIDEIYAEQRAAREAAQAQARAGLSST